ncbi:MAG: hypothetical protein V8S32_08720 [Lachnospiraceae bacterium]
MQIRPANWGVLPLRMKSKITRSRLLARISMRAASWPWPTIAKVAGEKMQTDFESVIERKIHAWFNYMEGVMHTGQINLIRIRVSNAAYEAGLRLNHSAKCFTT